MKRLLLFFSALVLSLEGFCQLDTSFNIANYARPNLIRKTASIEAFLKTDNGFGRKDNTSNFGLGTNLDFNFYQTQFLNTPIYQSFISNSIETGMDVSRVNFNALDPKERVLQRNDFLLESALFSQVARKKFSTSTSFLEVNYALDNKTSRASETNKNPSTEITNISTSIDTRLNFSIFKGKGRIELVNDAWQAVTILEALEKAGVLQTALDSASIQGFAERISEIKNFRNTDFRLEQIAQIESLCGYFFENQLTEKDNARFYAVLLDAWNYESFVMRFSGKEIKFGISPTLNVINNSSVVRSSVSKRKSRANQFTTALALEAQYNRYKPVSKAWQFNNTNGLSVGVFSPYAENIADADYYGYAQFRTEWEWLYLPSQRTNYSIGIEQVVYYNDSLESNDSQINNFRADTNFSLRWDYYVSPRFSWRINGGLAFIFLDTTGTIRYDQHISVSTNYRFY